MFGKIPVWIITLYFACAYNVRQCNSVFFFLLHWFLFSLRYSIRDSVEEFWDSSLLHQKSTEDNQFCHNYCHENLWSEVSLFVKSLGPFPLTGKTGTVSIASVAVNGKHIADWRLRKGQISVGNYAGEAMIKDNTLRVSLQRDCDLMSNFLTFR